MSARSVTDLWVPPSAEAVLDRVARRRELAGRPTRLLMGQEAIDHLARREEEHQRARDELHARGFAEVAGGSVPGGGFSLVIAAAALTAATAKTLLAYSSSANTPVDLVEFGASCDAVSGNVLIELCYSTAGTAGTTGTAPTVQQIRGRTQTLNSTQTGNYSAEPGTQTRIKAWRLPLPGGPFVIQFPLGRETNSITASATAGKQICFRFTASVAVTNLDLYAEIEE